MGSKTYGVFFFEGRNEFDFNENGGKTFCFIYSKLPLTDTRLPI